MGTGGDMDEGRARLTEKLNMRRRELRLKWTDVARLLNMSPQNLLRIRQGDVAISEDAAFEIDNLMGWQSGGVNAVLEGKEPTASGSSRLSEDELDQMGRMSIDELLQTARQVYATSGEMAALFYLIKTSQVMAERKSSKKVTH